MNVKGEGRRKRESDGGVNRIEVHFLKKVWTGFASSEASVLGL
jgi:hypothetical protein